MPTGVYKRGVYAKRKYKPRKHGLCNIPEYRIWLAMRSRCKSSRNTRYKDYGGRGIQVDKRWNDFKIFFDDMGKRPEGKTLDRINNNGNYCKENCRWATKIQQANNTRDNRKIIYRGLEYSIRELSQISGVSKKLITKRIFERGWDVERAVINKSFIGRNQYNKQYSK